MLILLVGVRGVNNFLKYIFVMRKKLQFERQGFNYFKPMLLLCMHLIFMLNVNAQHDYTNDDFARFNKLYNQSFEIATQLKQQLPSNILLFYKSNATIKPVVADKLLSQLYPIFNTQLTMPDRLWYCNYILDTKQQSPSYYPLAAIEAYRADVLLNSNKK
jgi:hypothetical protein